MFIVMIILDRNMDLTTVFHHTWTYQALVHDVLHMQLNRVTVDVRVIDPRLSELFLSVGV